ncbi:hypothetical protein KSS87_003175, partial [Heliosperma pusillum]
MSSPRPRSGDPSLDVDNPCPCLGLKPVVPRLRQGIPIHAHPQQGVPMGTSKVASDLAFIFPGPDGLFE